MAENSDDDKTEEPTDRRLEKARDDGQVARSQDLTIAITMILVATTFFMFGGYFFRALAEVFSSGFVFDRRILFSPQILPAMFGKFAVDGLLVVAPIFGLTVIIAIASSLMMGGFIFSLKAVEPKLSRLSPLEGIKKVFGMKALIELLKAVAKFTLITSALYFVALWYMKDLSFLGVMPLEPSLESAAEIVSGGFLLVTLSLIVIASIDVPYQLISFKNRMMMSIKEIKDESKDAEGRPEVKAQIRRRQRELAMGSMLEAVAGADVVITNPEHFAVALAYDAATSQAPRVVAAGIDFAALRIKEQAIASGVMIFEAPPLARALYYTADVNDYVPEELYHAVAMVIAYVFSMNTYAGNKSGVTMPKPVVPKSMQFDSSGNRVVEE
ncbi:flagellar biosynthesis protein FlhB [Pseudomonadales bacterium]|nr:flagellar biosynthesis protein FlhB [Pseudomonadales bacterium]